MKRFVAMGTVLLATGCAHRKTDLEETLEWMDNTYNPHENVSGAYGHGRMAWYAPGKGPNGEKTEVLAVGETETLAYKGCELSLKADGDPTGNEALGEKRTREFSFNLKDIDPGSITTRVKSRLGDFSCDDYTIALTFAMGIECDHGEMDFKTRNEAGLIGYTNLTGGKRENGVADKTNSAYFVFNDPDYEKLFAKAFGHAVELCGGKASPF